MDLGDTYERLRPQLISIAYQMLGSLSEAEDVVQDAFVRAQRADDRRIDSPTAYMTTITTRLAIDQLRSARLTRQAYPGPWLPEPMPTEPEPDPGEHAALADTLSLALLTVLERLSPTERAVFLLHESFGYSYDEIGGIIGKSEVACRQLAARARRHVTARQSRFLVAPRQHQELTDRFIAACQDGRVDQLLDMLTADAVAYSDGGGKVHAALRPIYGRDKVARFLTAVAHRGGIVAVRPIWANGQPARLLLGGDGQTAGLVSLDIVDGLIQTIHIVLNPDKLRHLPADSLH